VVVEEALSNFKLDFGLFVKLETTPPNSKNSRMKTHLVGGVCFRQKNVFFWGYILGANSF
jgi:hypothetical protein